MKQAYLSSVILLLGLSTLSAQFTAEKVIADSLSVDDFAEVRIENQYGNIVVTTWDQPKIVYEFVIDVDKKEVDDAEELLARIVDDVDNFGRLITIKSQIKEKEAGFFGRLLSDFNIDFDKSSLDINLDITVPSDVELNVVNAFGDVIVLDYSGKLSCEVKHGDIKVSDGLKSLDLTHSFGEATLNNIGLAKLNLRNSELTAEKADDLHLDSHGSEIQIKEIGYLNIESNKDEFRAVSIDRVKGQMRFGDMNFDAVNEEINLELSVTDLRVTEIQSPNPRIFIEQSNSDVDLGISSTGFNLKATMKEGVLRLPDSMKNVHSETIDKKDNIRVVTGSYGLADKGEVEFKGRRGYIILRDF